MHKIRVGVLRGGISPEYEVSLQTGKAVLEHLPPEKYEPVDMLVSRRGEWHANGVPVTLGEAARKVDVVWNALHGEYGEDGKAQKELEHFRIPYTGSAPLASALGMHKHFSRERFSGAGLSVPAGRWIQNKKESGEELEMKRERGESEAGDDAALALKIFREITPPWIVKPVSGGSSVGVVKVKSFPHLQEVLEEAKQNAQDILIEEFIRGREATVGVIDTFRGERYYATLPTEIIPPDESDFFDYEAKYGGKSQEICPGNFSREESRTLQDLARKAHHAIGARHYSRSDFIVTPRGIYILEINTLPGLTEQSFLPQSLHAVGSSLPEFLDHVIGLVFSKK